MGKYLHHYTSESDFQKDYNGKGEVTAITVNSALIYQSCNDEHPVETHDYDGRYVFDREEEITNPTTCDGSPAWFSKVRVFKNGNKEIYCEYDTEMNIWSYEFDDSPWVSIYQDFSHLFQAGDGYSEDFALEYSEVVYHEPWVSYTTDNCVSKFSGELGLDHLPFTAEYVGECDWYQGLF